MTTEEKAKKYFEQFSKKNWHRLMSSIEIESAYIAGAKEALTYQWKSVEDELPEMFTRVLVCIQDPNKFPHIHICKRIYHDMTNPKDDKWHWTNVVRDSDVVAWMPLPEPPKNDKK